LAKLYSFMGHNSKRAHLKKAFSAQKSLIYNDIRNVSLENYS
jgi:hypothetical protein